MGGIRTLVIVSGLFAVNCVSSPPKNMNSVITHSEVEATATLREQMVKEQLERRGIRDARVLKAMGHVPREKFVPAEYQDHAYDDGALPIGYGQTISQPYIVAFMTETLSLTGKERVLEIGTGSGYQAAVLAELVRDVYSIEIVEPLARRAEKMLRDLSYSNVHTRVGNGYVGWTEEAPFDAIIVTAAPDEIPATLVEQLKFNGRMIVPVGVWVQDLILVKKTPAGIVKQTLLPVRFVPMVDEPKRKE
jgi:protein-L-isoaspartate(D-aspartate) O-methyltransferase